MLITYFKMDILKDFFCFSSFTFFSKKNLLCPWMNACLCIMYISTISPICSQPSLQIIYCSCIIFRTRFFNSSDYIHQAQSFILSFIEHIALCLINQTQSCILSFLEHIALCLIHQTQSFNLSFIEHISLCLIHHTELYFILHWTHRGVFNTSNTELYFILHWTHITV